MGQRFIYQISHLGLIGLLLCPTAVLAWDPGAPFVLPPALQPFAPPSESEPVKPEPQPVRLEIRLRQRQVVVLQGEQVIKRYPIAVGKPGWETPPGNFQVRQKIKDPDWVSPLNQGVLIPGGDPENPLGRFWIGFWTDGKNWIGFHGTPTPGSVGRAVSHGCIRMYNRDVEELFQKVDIGTVVTVVP